MIILPQSIGNITGSQIVDGTIETADLDDIFSAPLQVANGRVQLAIRDGLWLDDDNSLNVLVDSGAGLTVTETGVGISLGDGVTVDESGILMVNAGAGVKLDAGQLVASVDTYTIQVDQDGKLYVDPSGFIDSSAGLAWSSENGLGVKVSDGLDIDEDDGVYINLKQENSGLTLDNTVLSVAPDDIDGSLLPVTDQTDGKSLWVDTQNGNVLKLSSSQ